MKVQDILDYVDEVFGITEEDKAKYKELKQLEAELEKQKQDNEEIAKKINLPKKPKR